MVNFLFVPPTPPHADQVIGLHRIGAVPLTLTQPPTTNFKDDPSRSECCKHLFDYVTPNLNVDGTACGGGPGDFPHIPVLLLEPRQWPMPRWTRNHRPRKPEEPESQDDCGCGSFLLAPNSIWTRLIFSAVEAPWPFSEPQRHQIPDFFFKQVNVVHRRPSPPVTRIKPFTFSWESALD